MSRRDFPFTPRTSNALEVGDFWAVEIPDGGYGCLQVTELAAEGPGSRSTLVAGVVDWWGTEPPTAAAIAGRRIVRQGLTRIEAFTFGGAQILGRAVVTHERAFPSHYRDRGLVGIGMSHQVWGWQTLTSVVADTLKDRS